MRYSRAALSALDDLCRASKAAATRIQTGMAPGESAYVCHSRQFDCDLIAHELTTAYAAAMAEVAALGSASDCIHPSELPDIEATIRQLFEDGRHQSWMRTYRDAQFTEAAE